MTTHTRTTSHADDTSSRRDPNLRFLVYRKGAIDALFSGPLEQHGDLVDQDGSQRPQDFDLLVLDAATLSPLELARHAGEIRTALSHDKPALILQPTYAHKQKLSQTKEKLLRHRIEEGSVALLIEPRRDAAGGLRVALAEQFAGSGGQLTRTFARRRRDGTIKEGPVDTFQVAPAQLADIDVTPFINRVKRTVATLASGEKLPLAAGDSSPSNPPAGIPSGLYDVTPITIYNPITAGGSSSGGYTTPTGDLYLEGLVTIGVYYDNTSFNTPVQWLIIEHSGLWYTAGLEANDQTHIGWSVGMLAINGQNISSSTLVSRQSSPNNVNGQTQYTSGSEFSVGLSAGTDGLSANASYTISSSQTSSLSDWSVVQSDPNTWTFAQAVPYNGATAPGTFPSGAAGSSGVAALPPISSGSLAYCTQSVWAQTPATQTNVSVPYALPTQSFFTYESETGKSWQATSWCHSSSYSQTYAVDFSAAWPSS